MCKGLDYFFNDKTVVEAVEKPFKWQAGTPYNFSNFQEIQFHLGIIKMKEKGIRTGAI